MTDWFPYAMLNFCKLGFLALLSVFDNPRFHAAAALVGVLGVVGSSLYGVLGESTEWAKGSEDRNECAVDGVAEGGM